jgi:outer membrane protein
MNAARRASHYRFLARRWRGTWLACLLLLGAGLLAGAGPAFAQEGSKVGYVDMQRLIDNAPQVLAARARLEQEFGARDRDFKSEQARLAALDARVVNEATTLPAAELETLRRNADALRRSIDRTRTRLREELATRREQELERAWPLITEAVSDFAREEGYDLIVPSPVVYASGRVDITDRVLDRLKRDAAGTQP